MRISNKALNIGFSPIRKLIPYCDIAEQKGLKIYKLNIGQPDIEAPESFFEGLRNYTDKVIRYSDSRGLPELNKTFIEEYKKDGIEIKNDEILVTQGGSEAITYIMLTICDEGDEILIPEPFYPNYTTFTKISGAKIVPIPTDIKNGYHLPSKETIVNLITPRTRGILFSNPGNPTGTVYTKEEVEMIGEIVKEHNLYMISDEVYKKFIFEKTDYLCALKLKGIEDRVMVVDSISKNFSACGARIGHIATRNKDLYLNLLKLCQSRLSAPTIEQFAASNLINTPDSYFNEVRQEYKERRDLVLSRLEKMEGVISRKPEGAFYIFIELPVDDAEKFAIWMLTDFSHENKTLLVAPGPGFYAENSVNLKKNTIRISFCSNKKLLDEALDVLEIAIKEYNKI